MYKEQSIEFEELLNKISVSDFNKGQENFDNIEKISDWVINNLPKQLYRFRTCNPNSLKSLQDDEIWGSTASSFNDPMECIPSYNIERMNVFYNSILNPELMQKLLHDLKCGETIPDIDKAFSQETLNIIRRNIPDNVPLERVQQISDYTRPLIFTFLQNRLSENELYFFQQAFIFEKYRNIACFSQNLNSTLMWGHYASSHTGFAIQYNMDNYIMKCKANCDSPELCCDLHLNIPLAPVVYSEKRVDATSYFQQIQQWDLINQINIPMEKILSNDKFIPTKCMLTKSKDWSYEEEWRMYSKVNSETIPQKHRCILNNVRPEAVFIGTKTSKWYENRIKNICKKKCIPCYKMLSTFTTTSFDVVFNDQTRLV